MPTSRFERFLPISGVIAGVLFALHGYLVSSPSADSGGAKQVAYFTSHETRVIVSSLAGAFFCLAIGFFATGLRQALRSGEPGESTYSSVAYGGALLVGFATVSAATLQLALYEAAHDKQAAVMQTLAYLGDYAWLPWVAATAIMMFGVGIGGLRTAALPKWLSIATIVLGVGCALGPVGILVFIVSPVWFIVTGVVLARRVGRYDGAPVTTPSYATAD